VIGRRSAIRKATSESCRISLSVSCDIPAYCVPSAAGGVNRADAGCVSERRSGKRALHDNAGVLCVGNLGPEFVTANSGR
jgi:hypothetical protein